MSKGSSVVELRDYGSIPTGKFAELNCVTKKTLRLYREMGLLVPVHVDEETGWCYYSIDQCSTIDMIQQLQNVGMSLAQIKELADNGSRGLALLLQQRLDALDVQILELLTARQNATQLLQNCRWCHHNPIFDTPIIERLPVRHVMAFDILNPGAARLDDDVVRFMGEWELNLRLTKRHMLNCGLPPSLFHHVGCRIDRAHLLRRDFVLDASFVFIEDGELAARYGAGCFPGGDYLTMYKRGYSEGGCHNAEIAGLNAMLSYVGEHGFSIAGDYYGQIIAETPAFHYDGREMLFKLMVPIRLD